MYAFLDKYQSNLIGTKFYIFLHVTMIGVNKYSL